MMNNSSLPKRVRIVEVGPRDGLQNESKMLNADERSHLIERLAQCGLKTIEVGSFVSPKWVPQMAHTDAVFEQLKHKEEVSYVALVPNEIGLQAAIESGVDEVAIFAAASESFSEKNINCSIEDSFKRFEPLIDKAKKENIKVRAYLSCVVACPYEGPIKPQKVAALSERLIDMGCYEVSLGDTIGVATPGDIDRLLDSIKYLVPLLKVALHCHDTYGQALANIYRALEWGVTTFDSSVAGLGGCPYAEGASGNVSTEDLVYLLNGLDIKCEVDLGQLIKVGNQVSHQLGRQNQSKVGRAMMAIR